MIFFGRLYLAGRRRSEAEALLALTLWNRGARRGSTSGSTGVGIDLASLISATIQSSNTASNRSPDIPATRLSLFMEFVPSLLYGGLRCRRLPGDQPTFNSYLYREPF